MLRYEQGLHDSALTMANYGLLAFVPTDLEGDLRGAVSRALDDRWVVRKANFEDGGPVWIVELPGTARRGKEATKACLPSGENVGFAVALEEHCIAFRHGPNNFEGWAQGCVEEELADLYGVGVEYDATGRIAPPGTRERREFKKFKDYIMRGFDEASADDLRFIEQRYRDIVPEGHW